MTEKNENKANKRYVCWLLSLFFGVCEYFVQWRIFDEFFFAVEGIFYCLSFRVVIKPISNFHTFD